MNGHGYMCSSREEEGLGTNSERLMRGLAGGPPYSETSESMAGQRMAGLSPLGLIFLDELFVRPWICVST